MQNGLVDKVSHLSHALDMTGPELDLEVTEVLSVRGLINHRLVETDRWNLAPVQRDEVWDDVRMRQLVDSLLAGYPIGSILLSRLRRDSSDTPREIAVKSEGRVSQDAPRDSWQILDGQQRINALVSVFTDQGSYGRFFFDPMIPRPEPSPAQRRSRKARGLPHLRHTFRDTDSIESRERLIDLSRWHEWAERNASLLTETPNQSDVAELLRSLDPEFTADPSEEEARIAADNIGSLFRAWSEPKVPVLRAELRNALEILEVFTRINLGGVPVAGDDVYFAGVKTYWRDAESRMDSVLAKATFLKSRTSALRTISRIASRGVGYGDILPLSVERLVGQRGEVLRQALEELTEPSSPFLEKASRFSSWYAEHSELRFVLRMVHSGLWDEVYAWVVTSQRVDDEWFAENRHHIDTYLLAATIFRYDTTMRDTFKRLAMVEALEAGRKGRHFPATRIAEVARSETDLKGSRGSAIPGHESAPDRAELASRGGWILTALEQQIPYDWQARNEEDAAGDDSFDWDHIFPRAQSSRMWRGSKNRPHPNRKYVNSTGNFWALKAFANRSLQDTSGENKFKALHKWTAEDATQRIWPRERWALTDDEIEAFITVDRLLNDTPESIEQAMEIFQEITTSRSLRLLDRALERFPGIVDFSSSSTRMHSPATAARDYRAELGINASDASLTTATLAEAVATIEERSHELRELIQSRLTEFDGHQPTTWLAGRNPASKTSARKWIAFELRSGICIELMPRWKKGKAAWFEAKAYPQKGKWQKENLFPDFDHKVLEVQWSADDDEVATEFLRLAKEVELIHGQSRG